MDSNNTMRLILRDEAVNAVRRHVESGEYPSAEAYLHDLIEHEEERRRGAQLAPEQAVADTHGSGEFLVPDLILETLDSLAKGDREQQQIKRRVVA